jgi:hypothetical protein
MPRAVLALFWLLGGAAFAPLIALCAIGIARGKSQDIWKQDDLLRSCEIWSPQAGRWTRTGDLPEPLAGHQMLLLKGGDVLAMSTEQSGLVAIRWSPASGNWSAVGVAPFHSSFRLIALRDGRALVTSLETAAAPGENLELFDPAQNGWRSIPGPGFGGVVCAAEFPAGVAVLTSDPLAPLRPQPLPRTRAALLDLASGAWTELARPPETDSCTLTPLLDGRTLLAFERTTADPADTALAVFDGRRFALLHDRLAEDLAGLRLGSERLDDGRVLHLRLWDSRAVLWDPRTERVSTVDGPPPRVRRPEAVVVPPARVLISGGIIPTGDERHDLWDPDTTSAAQIWDLDAKSTSPVAPMLHPRETHALVRLADGRVLVSGGRGPAGHPLWPNLLALVGSVAGAPALLACVGIAFRRSRSRAAAALAFLAGVAVAAGITVLLVLSQLRFPS